MNIAIVGGRDFNDYTLLKESILAYIDAHEKPENLKGKTKCKGFTPYFL